jgi:hypothetical protein
VRLLRKLFVNVAAAGLALGTIQWAGPLTASDAFLVGFLAAVLGTAVMEYG